MEENTQAVNVPQGKCPYCAEAIPSEANVCSKCRLFRNPWRNHFRVEHMGLILTIVIILIASTNLNETRKDRIEARKDRKSAGEALEKANRVEVTVKKLEADIASLSKGIEVAREQVARVNVLAADSEKASQDISSILQYVRNLQSQMDQAKQELQQLGKKITAVGPVAPTLRYDKSHFRKSDSGLEGVVEFLPSSSFALSPVEFVVSVKDGSRGRILKIDPGMPISMMVTTMVARDGLSASVKYTVAGPGQPSFRIILSDNAILIIEGKPGVDRFSIEARQ